MAELTENLLRLKMASGVGNLLLWRLLGHFNGSDRLLGASVGEIAQVEGVSEAKARGILDCADFDPRPEMERALAAGVRIIPYDDPEYPKPLLMSFDPPSVLYVFGNLTKQDQVAVGIVGTRHATRYGREQAEHIAASLARAGYTIVSGLARGIDTYAHCGALDAGGRTVGVLGCGFKHMYPEENRDLAIEMSRHGAVVSEFPMAMKPSRTTFPARNRIIAAMSLGVVVIEAPLRSGALITAKAANDIGRTVFALPGRLGDVGSEGCNRLIADGAVLVASVDNIFHELNPSLPVPPLPERKKKPRKENAGGNLFDSDMPTPVEKERRTQPKKPSATQPPPVKSVDQPDQANLSPEQREILSFVGDDWQTIDDIAEKSPVPVHKVTATLTLLRMKRLVEQGPGQSYRLPRKGE